MLRATGECIRGSTPTGSLSLFIQYQRHLIRHMGSERTMAYRLRESLLDESERERKRSTLLPRSGWEAVAWSFFLFLCFVVYHRDDLI